jgi:hypothetical protein
VLATHSHALCALRFASTLWAESTLVFLVIAQITATIILIVPFFPLSLYFLQQLEIPIFFLTIYFFESLFIMFYIFQKFYVIKFLFLVHGFTFGVISKPHQEISLLVKMKSNLLSSKSLNLNFGWHFLTYIESVSPFVYFSLILTFVQAQYLVRHLHDTSPILFSLPLEEAPLHLVHYVRYSLFLPLCFEFFLFLFI